MVQLGLHNKLQVEGVDQIVALLVRCMEVSGKGTELLKAYRQMGVCEDHLKFAWIYMCMGSNNP